VRQIFSTNVESDNLSSKIKFIPLIPKTVPGP
jgi:hypothetical protein